MPPRPDDFRGRPRAVWYLAVALSAGLAGCAVKPVAPPAPPGAVKPAPERVQTISNDGVTVELAIPSEEEAARQFGVPLAEHDIQPIWIRVWLAARHLARRAHTVLDPVWRRLARWREPRCAGRHSDHRVGTWFIVRNRQRSRPATIRQDEETLRSSERELHAAEHEAVQAVFSASEATTGIPDGNRLPSLLRCCSNENRACRPALLYRDLARCL